MDLTLKLDDDDDDYEKLSFSIRYVSRNVRRNSHLPSRGFLSQSVQLIFGT